MDDQALYLKVAERASKQLTKDYSTSFFRSICMLHASIRQPVFNIYGMVRIADEIVDSFQDRKDIERVFALFVEEVWASIERRYSTNLILHSFQHTYHQYQLERSHVEAFLYSMEMDLSKKTYNDDELKQYIYGSAEVVGLMCLKVFCHEEQGSYEQQKEYARWLGSFFQKINFLRDIAADYQGRERIYFSLNDMRELGAKKEEIMQNMRLEMNNALAGIKRLPRSSRLGVYLAYSYYKRLLLKINRLSADELLSRRVSVSCWEKIFILTLSNLRFRLGLI